MKQEMEVEVVACRSSAGVTSKLAGSPVQPPPPFPTPSPFSFSIASSSWGLRSSISMSCLVLRFLAFIFSFVSAISLATQSRKKNDQVLSSFIQSSELLYCFIASILAFVYSAFQLFKGVCDIAHRGILISDVVSDYASFTLDQLVGYLLISSSSVALAGNQQIEKAIITSVIMSFATFVVVTLCGLLSGYKLCKRIMW